MKLITQQDHIFSFSYENLNYIWKHWRNCQITWAKMSQSWKRVFLYPGFNLFSWVLIPGLQSCISLLNNQVGNDFYFRKLMIRYIESMRGEFSKAEARSFSSKRIFPIKFFCRDIVSLNFVNIMLNLTWFNFRREVFLMNFTVPRTAFLRFMQCVHCTLSIEQV